MIDISKFDMTQFDIFRKNHYASNSGREDGCCEPEANVEKVLQYWATAKDEYLTKIFDGNLILERPVQYNQSDDELRDTIEDYLQTNEVYNFTNEFSRKVAVDFLGLPDVNSWRFGSGTNTLFMHLLLSCFQDLYSIVENRIPDMLPKTLRVINHKTGKPFTVTPGEKILKFLGKLAKAIDMEKEFENYRIKLSQITNTAKISGDLCLSIHPLDYATASDNDNGWSSCMSWDNDGCYRLGTIEMMNSPMVICAYLKSNRAIYNDSGIIWNSKKWRCWIILTKDAIICNKPYPYYNYDLSKNALKWVAELATKYLGWQYSTDMIADITKKRLIKFETNYMYNDFVGNGSLPAILSNEYMEKWNSEDHVRPKVINFSGVANCMKCGEIIDFVEEDKSYFANAIEHIRCIRCSCCGRILESDDSVYYSPDDEILCEDCYYDKTVECDECGQLVYDEESVNVTIPSSIIHNIAKRVQEKNPEKYNPADDFSATSYIHFYKNSYDAPFMHLCSDCYADYIDQGKIVFDKDGNPWLSYKALINADYSVLVALDLNHLLTLPEVTSDMIIEEFYDWYNRHKAAD